MCAILKPKYITNSQKEGKRYGNFYSLFKSTVRRVVNDVVDKTVDATLGKAFDQSINNSSSNNNTQPSAFTAQQPQQNSTINISRPALSGETYNDTLLTAVSCTEVSISFEKAEKLYQIDSGAAEVPIAFAVADSEADAYSDNFNLPQIYIGMDDLVQGQPWMKYISNVIVSDVVGHSCIKKKYSYEYHRKADAYLKEDNSRCKAYKFSFLKRMNNREGILYSP